MHDIRLAVHQAVAGTTVADHGLVGDTGYDMLTGRNAGAAVVAHREDRLRAGGATHLLPSIAEMPALLFEGMR
ncbi:HAD family hydrolase [Kitasatospora sp. NPDC059327]|uniref:HAD family hydrolase n=1 Tax=Kitasatospora sp. NPDC059327 TaxID=3346803 RepID=UPI00369734B9